MADNKEDYAIAIVSASCRFPLAQNLEQYWRNLLVGQDCVTNFGEEELLQSGVQESAIRHRDYVASGGVIDGATRFDAEFFGYVPSEAKLVDPQHRIFLNTAR
ncbi:MAG: beta-ketoacyl synthase N-terminal-like domain-containing protein, partial [Cyanobacteria bacterium P01_D01_bin.116]